MPDLNPADFWNERYSEGGFAYGDRPSRLLMAWADVLQDKQTAFVPACGEGRDAVYLAEQGLEVTAVDVSDAGIEKTRQLAAARGVSVAALHADLRIWDWPHDEFDIAALMFAHLPSEARKDMHAKAIASLKQGGLLFIEGFSTDQIAFQKSHNSGGPPDEDMLYTLDSLNEDFSGCEPLALWSGVETLSEGRYHTGPAALIRAVFQRTGN